MIRAKIITFKRARLLRREMTVPEVLLWSSLRGGRLGGLRFRRQHPIGDYILDYYCPSAKLAVEVDGEGHGHPEQARHDEARDRRLESKGVRVLRLSARSIMHINERAGVLADIERAAF